MWFFFEMCFPFSKCESFPEKLKQSSQILCGTLSFTNSLWHTVISNFLWRTVISNFWGQTIISNSLWHAVISNFLWHTIISNFLWHLVYGDWPKMRFDIFLKIHVPDTRSFKLRIDHFSLFKKNAFIFKMGFGMSFHFQNVVLF